MKKNLFILITLIFIITNDSYSMEVAPKDADKKIDLICIKDLLTKIKPRPAIPNIRANQETTLYEYKIDDLYLKARSRCLIQLWNQSFDSATSQLVVRFCPTIIRYKSGGKFKNLGSLDNKTHLDAQEACRLGRAVYVSYQQGAIIYHLSHKIKRNDIIWKDISKQISLLYAAIDHNYKKPIHTKPIN
jgi:hypothetical protein